MEENKIYLDEAIEKAKERGVNVSLGELASLMFPNTAYPVKNLRNMRIGVTNKIEREQAVNACNYLGCTLDELFNYKK